MAAEANVLINIEGKPYVLSKHLKKSNLIDIITKLHEDLTKIKHFTKSQVDCKTQLEKLQAENKELQTALANIKNSQYESQSEMDQVEIRKRMTENYEKKALYASQLYEEKIDLLKKQIIEIEKDRETFAEVIETKQKLISSLKQETLKLRKEIESTDEDAKQSLNALRLSHESELHRMGADKQKVVKEMEVLQRTYIDLDKIRKYLEKNNQTLKSSLLEAQNLHEERLKALQKDFDLREEKHLSEIKSLRQNVEIVIQEAESKIEKIEQKMRRTSDEHQGQISVALKENETLKKTIKTMEQNAQTLKNDISMKTQLLEETKKNYNVSLQSLAEKHQFELKLLEKQLKSQTHDFETKIKNLELENERLDRDITEKMRQMSKLETENEFLQQKKTEMKKVGEENSKKYLENYNILKEKVETMKSNYETEKYHLNTEIYNRDKVIDDLTSVNKKLEKLNNSLNYSNDFLKQENEKEMDKILLKVKNYKESYLEELEKLKETYNKKLKIVDNDLRQSKMDYEMLERSNKDLLDSKQHLEKTCENLRQIVDKNEQQYKTEILKLKEDFRKDGKFLKQDYEAQTEEILARNVKISDLERTVTSLKTTNQELQTLHEKNLSDILKLKKLQDENNQNYKNDLENLKIALSNKDQLIKELENKMTLQQTNFNATLTQMQNDVKNLTLTNEMKINEINSQNETQKQKYDILIYEFYKELKEQQNKTDELTRIKSNLEIENSTLKQRNSEIIVSISKQKEKFQHDSEFMRLLEYLVT